MRLLPLLLASAGAFALCHYYWIPALTRRLRAEPSIASIKQGSLLALAGFLRAVLLINTLTTAAIILIVLALQMTGGTSMSNVTSAIKTVQQWRALLVGFGPVWGSVVIIILMIALGIYARRKGGQRLQASFNRVLERDMKRLEQEREEGKWEELPQTQEMQKLQEKIMNVDARLRDINTSGATEAEATALKQKLREELQLLTQHHRMLDIQRRLKLTLDPEEAELPAPRSKWEKAQAFLMSRGLLASLGTGSRVLFLATFILLVPSLIGVYAVTTGKMLDDRLVELHDLRLELQAKEWEEAKEELGSPTTELTEEDKEVLEQVARAFEMAVPIPPPPPSISGAWYTMRSSAVRQEILLRAVKRSPTLLEQHPSGSQVESLDDLERQTTALTEKLIKSRGPSTQAGKDIYVELEDAAKRSPSFMAKLRTGVQNFQKPASIYDIRRMMITHIIGNLSGAGSPEFGNIAQAIDLKVNRPLYNMAQQGRAHSFLMELMGGGDLNETLRDAGEGKLRGYSVGAFDFAEYQSVMQSVDERLPVSKINVKASEYSPSLDALPEKHVDMKTAAARIEEVIRRSEGSDRLRDSMVFTDSLARYQDHFPGQLDADLRTERGKIISLLDDGPPAIGGIGITPGGGGGGGGRTAASRASFFRARNFSALRGFSRVGGVLIGREPSNIETTKLDCTDLNWEIEGRNVRLIMTTADGRRFRSRLHPMSLVYQAINYAADGRPLAATMVTATPLPELKILLHPTLVDTPMGHRVIELDRFVDTYARDDSAVAKEESRVEAQMALYQYAWACRLLAALSESGGDDSMEAHLYSFLQDPEIESLVALALSEADLLSDKRRCPLTAKKEFFDENLAALILMKANSNTSPGEFGKAVYDHAVGQYRAVQFTESQLEALLGRWAQPPPTFEIWSGVREKEFGPDPSGFMMLEGAPYAPPFDFMLQVAFTSPPAFGSNAQSESYDDYQPWEFPSLKEFIQKRVINSIPKSAKSRERMVLADAGEFAILQRMFRMAFNGQLGIDFPVEKIVLLSEKVSAAAPKTVTRTLRWNSRPGLLERIAAFEGLGEEDSADLQLVIEIRRALGVAKDDEQMQQGSNGLLPPIDR